jgi:hypothetical protein
MVEYYFEFVLKREDELIVGTLIGRLFLRVEGKNSCSSDHPLHSLSNNQPVYLTRLYH